MSKNKLSMEERVKAVESYILGIMGWGEVLRTYTIPKSTFHRVDTRKNKFSRLQYGEHYYV